MKFSDVYSPMPLLEMLDTVFDSLSWDDRATGTVGVGEVRGIKVQMTLASVTYDKFDGVNVTFAVYDGAKYTETFQNTNNQQSALIIGAVTNAINQKLQQFDWDFVLLVAKDNVASRSTLYTHIAKRLSKEQGLGFIDFNLRGAHVTLLTSLPATEVRTVIDNLQRDS